jgi:hypothetical protein
METIILRTTEKEEAVNCFTDWQIERENGDLFSASIDYDTNPGRIWIHPQDEENDEDMWYDGDRPKDIPGAVLEHLKLNGFTFELYANIGKWEVAAATLFDAIEQMQAGNILKVTEAPLAVFTYEFETELKPMEVA